ncbi:hypothetical protein cce_5162 [Crocosphaera subtropica ATCC 51142]|uniref:Uncharacterized protein n=1 Tax=Crocosphaera subtropica (strain ATCC 51142 / BH68) TaxID=43989 RepID=B1X2Z7_CROS5|nr:hypothetical protein cce_5162 [Crocosphaera subtropica ATCC 51142]
MGFGFDYTPDTYFDYVSPQKAMIRPLAKVFYDIIEWYFFI